MGIVIGPIEEITFRTLTLLKNSLLYMKENNEGGKFNKLMISEKKMYDDLFKEIF